MDCLKCGVANSFAFTESAIKLDVDRNLAVAHYALLYQNRATQDTRHVSFAFPQDDSSALFEFEATVNDRLIQCEVRDKQEAREAFDKAVEAGFSAAMAGESDATSDLFNCYLGNVRAGSDVKIRMASLIELDEAEPGLCKLTLMRRLVPRYTPNTVQAKPASGSGQDAPPPSGWLAGRLEIEVCLADRPAAVSVECGQAGVEWLEAGRRFRLTGAAETGTADLEVRLRYAEPSGPLPQLLASLSGAGGSAGPAALRGGAVLSCELMLGEDLMLRQRSQPAAAPAAATKEFVLVVDRSGSMTGANIASAREALLLFLKSLPPDCYFNVVSFGSGFQPLFPTSQPYAEASLNTALALQATLEADMGGTEILQPLRWLFGQASPCARRSVVLITDGEVSNVQDVKDLVQASCRTAVSRLHAVGIGHGASTALVKGVARVGRGLAEFVRDNDAAQLRRTVVGLLKADRLEVIDSFELQVTSAGRPLPIRTVPESLDGLPSALRLRVFALVDASAAGPAPADLAVRATLSIGGQPVQLECASPRQSPAGQQLYQLAAARRLIKDWSDANADGSRTDEIKELSKATNLSSPYTTFVGIDRTGKQADPPNMPALEGGAEVPVPAVVCFDSISSAPVYFQAMACSAPMPRMMLRMACRTAAPSRGMASDGAHPQMQLDSMAGVAYDMPDSGASMFTESTELFDRVGGGGGARASPPPPPPPPPPKTDEQRALRIAQLQAFDGHWAATADLLAILGVSGERLRASLPAGLSEDAWTSALVLAFLETRLSRYRDEWELLAEKAENYLRRLGAPDLRALAKAALN